MRLIIDDSQSAFMVTSSDNWQRDNPDIVDYACVTGCTAEIREDRREVRHRTEDGHEEGFRPPRYDYEYDFYITITLNHPWFDDMRFCLASNVKDVERGELDELVLTCEDIVETMTGVRPDYAARVPKRPPFCRECGHELPEAGAVCLVCHPPVPPKPPVPPIPPMPQKSMHQPMPGPKAGGTERPPQQDMKGRQERADNRPVPNKPEVKGERGQSRDSRPDLPPRGDRRG